MSEYEVLGRDQWAIARKIFLAKEKEFAKLCDKLDALPSPRFSGEREGPIAKQWEGEGLVER